MVPHLLQPRCRMALPFRDLSQDAQRCARAIGLGGIAGEFLVGQVRIVDEFAGGLDKIDPLSRLAGREFGAQMAASSVPVK